MERGVGFDRSFHRLPVLLVDDFAVITPSLVRQAYVEAIYRADEWEYTRMSQRWWDRLLFNVSETGSLQTLLDHLPYHIVDSTFTRPQVPFDCKAMGGCGEGTKRVPEKSCGINLKVNISEHNWYWEQGISFPSGKKVLNAKEVTLISVNDVLAKKLSLSSKSTTIMTNRKRRNNRKISPQ